ncbi:hypothetical protein B0H11DRAFT_2294497 [Mycena galericulata]|nr:hypothetical protein B0H11DRAFT_2294497 [Mycena galericulata]
MQSQAPPRDHIFRGVSYHIRFDAGSGDNLSRLLDDHGAKKAPTLRDASRVIIDRADYPIIKDYGCMGTMVTEEWVYSSIKSGVKRPSQYYSADPAMFFSSIVISATDGVSAANAHFIRTEITKNGGEWIPNLTPEVTHLIVQTPDFNCTRSGCDPIVVSFRWFLDSLARRELQPTSGQKTMNEHVVSAARRFCDALPAKNNAGSDRCDQALVTLERVTLPFVPFDVLSEIFLEFREIVLEKPSSSMAALLRLSHVCSRWRSIAHCTGALWTYLHLNFHAKRPYRRLHKLVERWVARSQPRPLSISCYPRPQNPVIDFIMLQASRISHLSLQLPAAHFPRLLQKPSGLFPVLEDLTLSIIPKSATEYDPSYGESRSDFFYEDYGLYGISDGSESRRLWSGMAPITVFRDALRLRKFSLDSPGGIIKLSPYRLRLPWSNLTDIDLGSIMLTRLKFVTDDSGGYTMPVIPKVKLPLTALDWYSLGHLDSLSIFDPLILPHLKFLELRDGHQETLFNPVSSVLSTLLLPLYHLPARDAVPYLVELRMSIAISDDLLEFLMYDRLNPVLPRLERLVLACRHPEFCEKNMIQMVESRWSARTPPMPLRKVRMSKSEACSSSITHREVFDRIAQMVEDGLSFEYHN